jgi:hypothetical protein
MAMLSFCGIDASKDRLDVMVLPGQQSFAVRNDAAGCAELVARLGGLARRPPEAREAIDALYEVEKASKLGAHRAY